MQKLYTTAQAAEILGLSVRRVRDLSYVRGIGQYIGKTLVFTEKELDNMRNRRVYTRKQQEP